MARRAPIRVSAIERQLGTRYTADTLRALTRRYPRTRFVWIMGADNLEQFHQWRDWRGLARRMTIAVVTQVPERRQRAVFARAMADGLSVVGGKAKRGGAGGGARDASLPSL